MQSNFRLNLQTLVDQTPTFDSLARAQFREAINTCRAGQCHPCLLRHVSSGLSRNCRNERRPDVEEARFVAMNFMARQLDGHDRYRLSGRDGDGEKTNG